MFEDVDKNKTNLNQGEGDVSSSQPQSQPQSAPTSPTEPPRAGGGVEDIFASTEKAAPQSDVGTPTSGKPVIFQPKASTLPENLSQTEVKDGLDIKKYIIFGFIILLIVVVLGGGWYGFNKFFKNTDTNEINEQAKDIEISNELSVDENIIKEEQVTEDNSSSQSVVITPQDIDTDQDGLTDKEEMALGTNINSVDSDDDGLFDREEVEVYETDPLNPDTDQDSYMDGEEVKGGYNPKGEGRLFEIQ